MSSTRIETTAEQRFRQAFERLKENKPTLLEPGTPVSQNNVAKEAGCDPTALRKARFVTLVEDIKTYVQEQNKNEAPSKRQTALKQKATRQQQRDRIAELKQQRDVAVSQMANANRRVIELFEEVQVLRRRLAELEPPVHPMRR